MKRKSIFYALALCSVMTVFTACEDMFDLTSSSVQYENNHELESPADSLYSVVGILAKLQGIADQTILFGELRGDLVDENVNTENDLREIINYNVSPSNKYYSYRDYYAVINNCNYFLSKVDTTVLVSNQPVLLYEYAAVKAIRAWTYLQMTLIYKSVPFITEPILSVADSEKDYPYYTFEDVCDYFIDDLLPYVNTELPNYGEINKINSKSMFFPVRLLLGDMYMWKQDYANAARYYAEYAYFEQLGTTMGNGINVAGISTQTGDSAAHGHQPMRALRLSPCRTASCRVLQPTSTISSVLLITMRVSVLYHHHMHGKSWPRVKTMHSSRVPLFAICHAATCVHIVTMVVRNGLMALIAPISLRRMSGIW